jgi:hypothetical protein
VDVEETTAAGMVIQRGRILLSILSPNELRQSSKRHRPDFGKPNANNARNGERGADGPRLTRRAARDSLRTLVIGWQGCLSLRAG